LVGRFIGLSFGGYSQKAALHCILIDDTLSMRDQWKEGGVRKNAFEVAKKDAVLEIAKKVGYATTGERLTIIPLSRLVTEANYQPKVHFRLNDARTQNDIRNEVEALACSKLHVNLIHGLKKAQQLRDADKDSRFVLYVLSDFRARDWRGNEAEGLHKALVQLAQAGAKAYLIDTVHPYRGQRSRGAPPAHANLA